MSLLERTEQLKRLKAISSPLLETSIVGAQGVLMNITGGESLSLFEAQEAVTSYKIADEDVNMIFGTVINPELQDEIVVTVIATGFEDKPTSQGRKASSTGFGTSATSSTSTQTSTPREESFSQSSSSSRSSESVSERSHTTKDDDIPSFIRNREERRSRRTRR